MHSGLIEAIKGLAAKTTGPDGSAWDTLSPDQVRRLAAEQAVSTRQVELEALENRVVPIRYLRNMTTLGHAEQARLLRSQAAVVGLGGLGGTVIEILARAGVGALVLIDGDRFEAHNLNRQLLSVENLLGCFKAEAAAKRVAAVNSAVNLTVQPTFMTEDNALDLIKECQVVVDCLDNIPSRFILEAAARRAGIALVSAAIAGLTGHVTTIFPGDGGLALIHGPPEEAKADKGVETVLGNLPPTVLMTAAMESAEAIKVLLGRNHQVLRNKLWVMDLTDNTFEVLALA